jgi:hypothetical protein
MPLKLSRFAITIVLAAITLTASAQSIIIQKNIVLPPDTATSNSLIHSLNGFLAQKESANKDNTYVLKDDLLATSALLDEIKGMDNNRQAKAPNFYKPYLTNVVQTGGDNFIVQFSYIGANDGTPVLRASFRLEAIKGDGKYYFSSPLKMNTRGWKTKKINNITYHSRDTLPVTDAKAFQKLDASYDKRLNVPPVLTAFYYCDNLAEAMELLGIDYKMDYSGSTGDIFTSHENGERLAVTGWGSNTTQLYAHDLWHSHLHAVVSIDVINRPVDEGCAYLYGGSWGQSWKTILGQLEKYAADNPNADWLSLYTTTTILSGGNRPVYIAYALNALIVQQIEREKGFSPVIQLVSCGKRQPGDDNYFAALEKVDGINKANFNAKMQGLVKGAE